MKNASDRPGEISDYVDGQPYKFSSFTDENYDKFFLNDFLHNSMPKLESEQSSHIGFGRLDLDGEYILNSYSYRSRPFAKNIQTVFSGDSFTYGVGIPESGIWASQVAKHFNFEYINMGWPGASVTGIVGNLMHYFKVYGNPEYLFCMFPDLERMHFFLNKNIAMSSSSSNDGFQEIQLSHISDYSQRPSYAKKPYSMQDVFPNETAYYYSLKSIQFLEQYCDAAGIKFLWSFFHEPDHRAVLSLKNNQFKYYDRFIDTKQELWRKDNDFNDYFIESPDSANKVLCHEEERNIYGFRFDLAGDIEEGRNWAHFGVHRHIHAAEIFIEEIEKLNDNSWN